MEDKNQTKAAETLGMTERELADKFIKAYEEDLKNYIIQQLYKFNFNYFYPSSAFYNSLGLLLLVYHLRT